MRISRAQAQGLRDYQEDRFVVSNMPNGKLIAIMDGHGGADVSSLIARRLPGLWKKHPVLLPLLSYEPMVRSVFQDLNTLTAEMDAGSTMSLVFIPEPANEFGDRVITVAILGDSPVIIVDDEGKMDVSPMHNARSNPAELLAAQARGAFFTGGYICDGWSGPGLQMTRAMGDRALRRILNYEPEIYTRAIGPDSFVLLASDGLFDPSHHDLEPAIAVVVEKIKTGATAKELVDYAVGIPTGDNVTAIVVRFGNKESRRDKKLPVNDLGTLGTRGILRRSRVSRVAIEKTARPPWLSLGLHAY